MGTSNGNAKTYGGTGKQLPQKKDHCTGLEAYQPKITKIKPGCKRPATFHLRHTMLTMFRSRWLVYSLK